MRVGIIGAGAVGAASLLSLVMRGPPACEIVVLDKNYARAKGVVADLQYGATLSPAVELRTGDYPDLADAVLTIVTAGINERAGGSGLRRGPGRRRTRHLPSVPVVVGAGRRRAGDGCARRAW